eukprot:TRINITY_DN14161_c0_g1_i6.p1 TRINITY_DN14161_c0_g1~~TRINITY_DN14161_c0_g1_i6.p1  ORF type:complete len:147 (-),score=24.39 TRINITY_DN14161_c0_g1_i6:287-727(-)
MCIRDSWGMHDETMREWGRGLIQELFGDDNNNNNVNTMVVIEDGGNNNSGNKGVVDLEEEEGILSSRILQEFNDIYPSSSVIDLADAQREKWIGVVDALTWTTNICATWMKQAPVDPVSGEIVKRGEKLRMWYAIAFEECRETLKI